MTVRRALLAVLAASLIVLSGCVWFLVPPTSSQVDVIGAVEIRVTLCAMDSQNDSPGTDCTGTTEEANEPNEAIQLLLAFLVPEGAIAPTEFTGQAGAQAINFTLSQSYVDRLEAGEAPAPGGEKWVGYISDQQTYADGGAQQTYEATIRFGLPRPADGGPFAGPFRYLALSGVRHEVDTLGTARPVTCSEEPAHETSCFGDIEPPSTMADARHEQPTRDLGVLPGSATAAAGTTANVPFDLKYAGTATAAADFALSAVTGVPGASAAPSQARLAPASDSSNPVDVAVNVPAGTPPGTYDVTLTAALANGQTRTGTAKLTVTPPAAAPGPLAGPQAKDSARPSATAGLLRGQDIGSLISRGRLRLRVGMNEPGTNALVLTTRSGNLARSVTIARTTVRFAQAGTKRVTLRLNRRARSRKAKARLRELRRLRLVLRSTARDAAGNVRRGSRRLTLRR